MLSCSDSKLGSTFVTVGAVAPWGLFGQHIFNIQKSHTHTPKKKSDMKHDLWIADACK